jgi:hypothetical protein
MAMPSSKRGGWSPQSLQELLAVDAERRHSTFRCPWQGLLEDGRLSSVLVPFFAELQAFECPLSVQES